MTNLWFPKHPAQRVNFVGNTLFAVSGAEVWAVQHRSDSRMDDVDNEAAELNRGGLGSAVGAIGGALADVQVKLPERLHHWSTARDVPAAYIAPGQPTLMVVSGTLHLALSWRYDSLAVTFAIVDNRWLTTVTPVASGHVLLDESTIETVHVDPVF